MYFHDYRLAMETNENCHSDRNFDYEIKRQKSLKQELNCAFIRVDDQKDVDIFDIKQSSNQLTKQSTKKRLIDNVSMRLLGS